MDVGSPKGPKVLLCGAGLVGARVRRAVRSARSDGWLRRKRNDLLNFGALGEPKRASQ
jgi:hypothetical protein